LIAHNQIEDHEKRRKRKQPEIHHPPKEQSEQTIAEFGKRARLKH
jgi:hypothetical protein